MAVLDRTDALIQRDILEEFAWDPEVELARVGVSVVDGIVTLSGTVDGYPRKVAAERAAQRVHGVRAVANDLVVEPGEIGAGTDADLAHLAAETIESRRIVPPGEIRIAVEDGRIVLEGDVLWEFQRAAAEQFLSPLRGVRAIDNRVAIKPMPVAEAVVKQRIEQAFVRNAEVDAERIRVGVGDDAVYLAGTVSSWSEKRAAEAAAWKAEGVARVVNNIVVSPRDVDEEVE
jgi:osmotically-inducible protein OsmY